MNSNSPNSKSVIIIGVGIAAIVSIAALTGAASNAFISKLNKDADKAYAATVDVLKSKQLADWQANHSIDMTGNITLIPEISNLSIAPTDIIEIDGKFYINSDLVINPDGTHAPNCPCYYCKYIGADGIDEDMMKRIDNKDYILIMTDPAGNGNTASDTNGGTGTGGNDGYPYLGVDYISIDKDGNVIYVIQHDETLSEISSKIGYSVDAIASYNGIGNVNMIYEGSCLRIPVSEDTANYFKGVRDNIGDSSGSGNYDVNIPVYEYDSLPSTSSDTAPSYSANTDSLGGTGSIVSTDGVQFNDGSNVSSSSNGNTTTADTSTTEDPVHNNLDPVVETPAVIPPVVDTPTIEESTADYDYSDSHDYTIVSEDSEAVDEPEDQTNNASDTSTTTETVTFDPSEITGELYDSNGQVIGAVEDFIDDSPILDEPANNESFTATSGSDSGSLDWYTWYYLYCSYRGITPSDYFDSYAYYIYTQGGSYKPNTWTGNVPASAYNIPAPAWYDPYYYASHRSN